MDERSKVRWSQLKVGVLAFAAMVILAVLIFLLTGSRGIFQRNESVRTYMGDGAGMTESTPVRLNGILVGAVQGIKLSGSKDPNRAVEFELAIEEKYMRDIPQDSTAAVTADTAHAVISETASRAMAYVAISRGRYDNRAYIYSRAAGEADHEHRHLLDAAEVHQMRRGNKYSAAHSLRMILANDDRPRTMHAHAERAARHQLPLVVADLLERNVQRRSHRRDAWRRHAAAERARTADNQRIISYDRSRDLSDDGYGVEL